jgi:hypothetical protein
VCLSEMCLSEMCLSEMCLSTGEDLARVHIGANGRRRQAIGLILDVCRHVLQLWQVLAAVVCAEQQLATRSEAGAHIGPGATAVAAVRCGQSWCQCSCHVNHPFVVVGRLKS